MKLQNLIINAAAVMAVLGACPAFAAADRGEEVFQAKCAMCHSVKPADGDLAGPNLATIAGRSIGKKAGFAYSDTLKSAKGKWTPEALDAFLKDPAGNRPGTIMPFTGLKKEDDRTVLIHYLTNVK